MQAFALESRIKGRSVPFGLEGGGSEGNFFLEVVVQCGGFVSQDTTVLLGMRLELCSAAAWQRSWLVPGWFGFPHSQDDFQSLLCVSSEEHLNTCLMPTPRRKPLVYLSCGEVTPLGLLRLGCPMFLAHWTAAMKDVACLAALREGRMKV